MRLYDCSSADSDLFFVINYVVVLVGWGYD